MAPRLLLIDNFDSFVYNLAQAFGALGAEPLVIRNNASLEDLVGAQPDGVVVSPGPGRPEEAGVSIAAIRHFAPERPILGVCLGHQCIAVEFGGRVARAPVGPVHGKPSLVEHDGRGVFKDVVSPLEAARYHSLVVEEASVTGELTVSARSNDGMVMGIRHRTLPVEGVQFHPESVLTNTGPQILENFLETLRNAR